MESKALVYTVFAITLGYLLISTVPSQLAPRIFMTLQPDSEQVRGPTPDESVTGEEGEVLGDAAGDVPETESSDKAAADAASTAQDDAKSALSSVSGGYSMIVLTLILNLLIAFGVYLLARRRFV
jgi:hypothetical protein